jgi:AraC-like DNA-binding protein
MTRSSEDTVLYLRRADLPGFELRCVDSVRSSFVNYASGIELIASNGFQGQLWHRGAELLLEPGRVLCARPGEVSTVRRVIAPGGLVVMSIEPGSFGTEGTLGVRTWGVASESGELERQLLGMASALAQNVDGESARRALEELLARSKREFSLCRPESRSVDFRTLAAARLYDRLQVDAAQRTDLATLAGLVGLSRFQALRAFKRQYGLPPQAYQLRLRLSLAQRALREGVPPARVAAEFGFTDQSHLTRHFKKALGVTPASYARASAR